MTSGRFTPVGTALGIAVLTITSPGCGDDASPCTDCPAIEGRYRLDFADAGTPRECARLGVDLPQDQPLVITRTDGRITGKVWDISLQGTISAQGAFNLSGIRSVTEAGELGGTLNLTGGYTPPVEDGGTARLAGTFVASFTQQGVADPGRCNFNSPFSATRE